MEKLKFRAWNKHKKEWVSLNSTNGYIVDLSIGQIFAPFNITEYIDLHQSTGLLDVNQQTIYEGDIIQYTVLNEKLNSIVVWNSGCYWIRIKENSIPLFKVNNEVEIIGNIYDNIDLMKSV